MGKRERAGIRPGLIASVSFVGLIIYSSVSLLLSYMFMRKIIPTELMGILSKALMLAVSITVCGLIKKKVKNDSFANCIIGSILFCVLLVLASIISGEGGADPAGIVICLFLSITGCLIVFVKKDKYSKMHKKRHR